LGRFETRDVRNLGAAAREGFTFILRLVQPDFELDSKRALGQLALGELASDVGPLEVFGPRRTVNRPLVGLRATPLSASNRKGAPATGERVGATGRPLPRDLIGRLTFRSAIGSRAVDRPRQVVGALRRGSFRPPVQRSAGRARVSGRRPRRVPLVRRWLLLGGVRVRRAWPVAVLGDRQGIAARHRLTAHSRYALLGLGRTGRRGGEEQGPADGQGDHCGCKWQSPPKKPLSPAGHAADLSGLARKFFDVSAA